MSAATADAVVTLPDPTTPWWPHPALEPGWIAEHADSIDVAHLHFGFDHVRPIRLAAWCDELDDAGIPLVHTIHDLRNPHHADPSRHDLHLEILVARADHLFTLTDAAAEMVARRHGRRPEVVAHPGVLWDERMGLAPVEPGLVGIHLGPLRCNVVDAASCGGGGGRRRPPASAGACSSTSTPERAPTGRTGRPSSTRSIDWPPRVK